jgi:hypothetical protein
VFKLAPMALLPLLCAAPALAGDKIELEFGGAVQYDLRFRPVVQDFGTYYNPVPSPLKLSRNELIGKFKLTGKMAKFGMVSDLDFVLRAYPKVETLSDLVDYNTVTPFRFEAHDLYMYGRDMFGLKGLDLKVGQQKAMFGVGDQFNPTNTVSPNDLEDILLFGDQLGNLMVRVDYSPAWNWQITGILIPIFKPAMVPRTGYLAQTPDRYPFLDPELRWNLAAEQYSGEAAFGYPTIVRNVNIEQPEFSAANMQGFARVATTLGGQDMALSYHYGRSDIPQPVRNVTSQVQQPICEDPDDPESACVNGVLASDVVLAYPRMHVLGFNMAGEIPGLDKVHKSFKPLGYRFELAVIFPEETRLHVEQDNVQFAFVTRDGEYPYPNDNLVVDSRPFAKWSLGFDYTFNRFLYMNTQWVHGFVDEFGAGDWIQPGTYQVRGSDLREEVRDTVVRDCIDITTFSGRGETCAREWLKPKLGDYLVWGLDVKFLSGSATLRLFAIWDLIGVYRDTYNPQTEKREMTHYGPFTKEGASGVIYPAFMYNMGNGFEWHVGGLFQLGQPYSKFGAPETGGHQIWTRARYRF